MTYQKQNFVSGQILKAEHLNHIEDGIEGMAQAVLYTEQALTEEQKAQARENIGAASEDISPNIDAAVTQYMVENPVVNGMSVTLRMLLRVLLGAAVYTSDQSTNIELLETILNDQSEVVHGVTNNLVYVTTNNNDNGVQSGHAYIAMLTAIDGYALNSVTVTMSGVDITTTAYDGNGNICILAVTGDVTINASAERISLAVNDIALTTTTAFIDGVGLRIDGWGVGRATLSPVGQYLKKGVTYRFCFGNAGTAGYMYGVQIMQANAAGLVFEIKNSAYSDYDSVTARTDDTGWMTNDYTYKATSDNLIVTVNFKKQNGEELDEADRLALLENFTIEVV